MAAIRFVRNRTVTVGRVTCDEDGAVELIGFHPKLWRDLTEMGVLGADKRRYLPDDGPLFLSACLYYYSGLSLRAIRE